VIHARRHRQDTAAQQATSSLTPVVQLCCQSLDIQVCFAITPNAEPQRPKTVQMLHWVALHVTMVLQESWLFVASLSAGGATTMLVVHVPFVSALVVIVYCSGALVLRGLLVDVDTLQTCTDDVPSAMAGPQVATAATSTDQEEQAVQCVSKCAFCRCCAKG
jgi:hypothetical protein